ncbi:MAG: hypothetical protein J6I73_09365 [Treponema sp.]|nr:hypothetical protein [Treponema sp.]
MKIIPALYTNRGKLLTGAVNGFLQNTVTIPLAQESGVHCTSLVKKGDVVREGDVIAIPDFGSYSSTHAKIHASIPGIVEDVISCTCPDGRQENAVRIRMSGAFSFIGKKLHFNNWNAISPQSLTYTLAEKGVVNTFDTAKPISLATQIDALKLNTHKLLVVRLYDDDPDRITDSLLASAFFDDVKTGALITASALDADGIVFVLDAKSPLPDKFDEMHIPIRFVHVDIAEYPAGFREEIMLAVKSSIREEPFTFISDTSLYVDATTMIAVCNAVQHAIPSIEQYVYVSGECIPAVGLLKVCMGTTLRYLAEQCGGLKKQPAAVIVNGLMLGTSSGSLDAPVTKYVKSVSFLPAFRVPKQRQTSCMRCGSCRTVCPRKLSPDVLYRHASGKMREHDEYVRSSLLCSECGLCNSVCPARLPICQAIQLLQKEVLKNE